MNMLPVLADLHATFRVNSASGQAELRTLFQMTCTRHRRVNAEIDKRGPRLFAEIRPDLRHAELVSTPGTPSPAIRPRFRSSLRAAVAARARAPIGGSGNDFVQGKQPLRRRRKPSDVDDEEY
jgi:hypothetical protein